MRVILASILLSFLLDYERYAEASQSYWPGARLAQESPQEADEVAHGTSEFRFGATHSYHESAAGDSNFAWASQSACYFAAGPHPACGNHDVVEMYMWPDKQVVGDLLPGLWRALGQMPTDFLAAPTAARQFESWGGLAHRLVGRCVAAQVAETATQITAEAHSGGQGQRQGQRETGWRQSRGPQGARECRGAFYTSQLPKPPKAKLIAPPREAASASAPTEDRKALDSLLDKLQQQDELPEEIRQMMSQLAVSSAKTEAKALHKLVAQRQEASAALERVRTERLSFEAGWASYTQALVDLLQKQLGEREATLKDLDESQEAWLQRLTEATSALKQATRTGPVIDLDNEDEDAMEAEIDQAAQDSAKMEVRQQRLTAQHQQMLQLLTSVRDEATATAAPEKRDGSRTPRRRSKDAADQGMAAPPTEGVKLEPETQGVNAGKTRSAAGGDGQQPGTGAHF